MQDELKILIVEDVPSDAELAQREIKKSIESCLFHIVDNEKDFLAALENFAPDLVVSDYRLPVFDGMTALKLSQQFNPMLPFIIFTGSQNEDIAVECMKAGATDYVIKEYIKRLGSAVIQALEKKKTKLEQIRMETELIESERKYKTIFENIQDIYYETSWDGTILELSPSVISTLYKREELIGTNILHLYSKPEERNKFLATLSENEFVTDYEIMLTGKDGRQIISSITARKVSNEADGTKKITGLMRDVSERVRIRQELIEAKEKAEEMNRLKSFFLANMSHELRTPLSGILGFAELLSNQSTDPETLEMVKLIHTSGRRLLSTLNSILDLSRIEANRTEINWINMDLNLFLLERIELMESAARAKLIKLDYTQSQNEIVIRTDPSMLSHIVDALLNNAIKYTDKGEICVVVDEYIKDKHKWCAVRFIDTGIGIADENKEVIFEPFRQASEGYARAFEGIGLGLTLTKKFVELLGGQISIEQTSPLGSTFLLLLPNETGISVPPPEEAVVEEVQENFFKEDFAILPKLLLVDDDNVTRMMVKLMLQDKYDIEFAADGRNALMMIDEVQYQIILLDINLKENISGVDIVRLLRKSNRYTNTPVVAVTAYAMLGDRERFLEEGFSDYLSKPFSKEGLFAIIQKAEKDLYN